MDAKVDTELEATLQAARLYRVKKYKSTDDTLKLVVIWSIEYEGRDHLIWDFVPLPDMRMDMGSRGRRLVTTEQPLLGSRFSKRLQAVLGVDAPIISRSYRGYIDVIPPKLSPEGLVNEGTFDMLRVPSFQEVKAGTAPLIIGDWGALRNSEGDVPVPEEDRQVSVPEAMLDSSPMMLYANVKEREEGGYNFEVVKIVGPGPLELENTEPVSTRKPEPTPDTGWDDFPKDLPF